MSVFYSLSHLPFSAYDDDSATACLIEFEGTLFTVSHHRFIDMSGSDECSHSTIEVRRLISRTQQSSGFVQLLWESYTPDDGDDWIEQADARYDAIVEVVTLSGELADFSDPREQ